MQQCRLLFCLPSLDANAWVRPLWPSFQISILYIMSLPMCQSYSTLMAIITTYLPLFIYRGPNSQGRRVPQLFSCRGMTCFVLLSPNQSQNCESRCSSLFIPFSYYDANSRWQHMSKSTFLAFVSDIWDCGGLQHVKEHSFWIGGDVFLLLADVSPDVVAATSGWTLLAFLLYRRRMEQIIFFYTSSAYLKINSLTPIINSHVALISCMISGRLPEKMIHPQWQLPNFLKRKARSRIWLARVMGWLFQHL